ncbi:hypothetical protein AQUCO_07300018v1 [Aquilegia coerulea]|uniref:Rhodanese domain-containing protein n=1 Tax=Aquilegia coerulea TaxID=218851 RepID=A0A2G5C9T9_AQUCA|nr:hypothetical protein AQUCO_07300018v1 [Aquilegia coerulea]
MAERKEKVKTTEEEEEEEEEEEGVLLYYKYANVTDLNDLLNFYNSNCESLGLRGRVRLAPHGVNVTVGGNLSSLEQHIHAVKLKNSLFEGTDFKLASCNFQSNQQILKECGFTSLSIRVVKELVTFSSRPLLKSPVISNAGRHLSAVEFNTVLQSAGDSLANNGSTQKNKIILLDARNVYETRIGRFQTSKVETLDPKIRQYSDLCTWIDSHSEQLCGSNVLMYCTGGIRCEMASAYIRSKGAGYENTFQLFGGIQRYLEQFPDGGFFKGKNFVFDHRISVGSSNTDILGSCLLCGSPFDDYSSRCRCTYCRMLVLVCNGCQEKNGPKYVCELCQEHGKKDGSVPVEKSCRHQTEISMAEMSGTVELESVDYRDQATLSPQLPLGQGPKPSRKLRILCLHGFRQNASNFKGRTASLAKKLKNIVELVFIDAPHELPFIYRPRPTEKDEDSIRFKLDSSPLPLGACRKKFAWLVAQDYTGSSGSNWEMADEPFDPLQYQQQTDGFDVSLSYLKSVFSQMGPFDGVLGFSQGAAMVASLCREQGISNGEIDFKFAILCSGFALNLPQLEPGSVGCPSLHIFGNSQGKDRQIECHASAELASLFKQSCAVIITHESGHIIPTQPPYIESIKAFLRQFI